MVNVKLDVLLQGNICFLGAISQCLLNYGVEMKEEVLYGLGFGLDFRYKSGIDNEYLDMDCVNIITDYEKYKSFFNSILIDVDLKKTNSPIEFKELLFNNVGESILVEIDSFYLPYSSTYNSKHSAHVVVLTNINNKDFIIQDNYVSAIIPRKKMLTVALDDVVKWCDIHFSDPQYKYLMWSFTIDRPKYNFTKQFVQQRILEVSKHYLCKCEINENILSSKLAFRKLTETLRTFEANNYNFGDVLFRMNEKISANGGLYQTRKLYGKFINWYGENYDNNSDIIKLAYSFEELSQKWRIMSTILLKAALKGNVPNWSDIIKRCNENIEKEQINMRRFLQNHIE